MPASSFFPASCFVHSLLRANPDNPRPPVFSVIPPSKHWRMEKRGWCHPPPKNKKLEGRGGQEKKEEKQRFLAPPPRIVFGMSGTPEHSRHHRKHTLSPHFTTCQMPPHRLSHTLTPSPSYITVLVRRLLPPASLRRLRLLSPTTNTRLLPSPTHRSTSLSAVWENYDWKHIWSTR